MKQVHREQLFAVSREDLIHVSNKYVPRGLVVRTAPRPAWRPRLPLWETALTCPRLPSRYLGLGKSTHGLALLGPENADIAKDPSWIVR